MDFVSQLSNSVAYSLHKATYSPEADAYAKKQAAAAEAAKKAATDQTKKAEADKQKAETDAKQAADAAIKQKTEQERSTFSLGRLLSRIFGYMFTVVLILGCIALACTGASYATNLNVYRALPQRVFYAIYGFAFWIPVVLYSGVYREWWLQKPSITYGPLPIFDQPFEYPIAQRLFGWMTFTPDSRMESLKEWKFTS
jgi:hypothetical protein